MGCRKSHVNVVVCKGCRKAMGGFNLAEMKFGRFQRVLNGFCSLPATAKRLFAGSSGHQGNPTSQTGSSLPMLTQPSMYVGHT